MHSPALLAKLEKFSNWLFNCQVRMFAESYYDEEKFREVFDELFDIHCYIVDAICEEKLKELKCENAQNSLSQTTI